MLKVGDVIHAVTEYCVYTEAMQYFYIMYVMFLDEYLYFKYTECNKYNIGCDQKRFIYLFTDIKGFCTIVIKEGMAQSDLLFTTVSLGAMCDDKQLTEVKNMHSTA